MSVFIPLVPSCTPTLSFPILVGSVFLEMEFRDPVPKERIRLFKVRIFHVATESRLLT